MDDRPLRLVIFDVDGTLVDSQVAILECMAAGFAAAGRDLPPRQEVLGIVGLSLPIAVARLVPDDAAAQEAIVAGYRSAMHSARAFGGAERTAPLFPRAREVLGTLGAAPDTLLGVATGKGRPGLDHLLEVHGLTSQFQTLQTADRHPSKPHPAMVAAALAETGVEAGQAVMIGDTSFDMEMGKAAGVATVGVSWGYHDRAALTAADVIIDDFSELTDALGTLWA